MSSRKYFLLFLNVIISLLGVGMLSLFILMNSTVLKTIFLFLGVTSAFLAIFRWLNLLSIPLPEGHCKRLASSFGIFSGGLYYVLYGQSTIWIALAWLIIVVGFLAIVTALQRILVEAVLLRKLLRAYRQATLPNLPVPFVYIHAEPGLGVYLTQRLVAKIMNSLWEHQYLSPKSGLSVYAGPKRSAKWSGRYLWKHRQRVMILFIVSDSIRRYPVDFRKWLAFQAAAFVELRTSLGIDGLYSESFEEEANSGYRLCLGPTFTIWVKPLGKGEFISSYKGDQVLECSWGLQDRSLESVIAPLSNRLASTALPVVVSDSRLNIETRLIIQEIATHALTPVANSYLRFRLAQSDVERFLSLLDCIESLVRSSVIVLLINRWNKMGRDISDKKLIGKPLTLGPWVYLLQNLSESTISDELDKEICCFWKREIFQTQKQLISKVNEIGLYSLNCKGSSQIDWLRWFTDLRNVTRGHGVVEEASIAPFWHPLHEVFLEMVSGLRHFVLSSYLVAIEPSGKEIILRGWLRDKFQHDLDQKHSEHETLAFLKLPSNQMLLLYPLIIVKEHNVFVFDHLRMKERIIVLLDYILGERRQLLFSEYSDINPYKIWDSKKQQI